VISIAELRAISQARLEDARILLLNGRFDSAKYLCGYAVELALKARICMTLNWNGFPEERREFENLTSFKTHKLDVLLVLSGQEQRIKSEHLQAWSAVANWDPELRYRRVGVAEPIEVTFMLIGAEVLLKVL